MAKEYLKQLDTLIKQATSGRFQNVDLECKHFFSGAAVYANGRIFISLTPVGFAIKLPEEARHTLMKKKGVKPLRYFPEGPIKKDYVILPNTMLNEMNTLRRWIQISIEHVSSLPKSRRRKNNRS
ncbi:MAG: TfoX/Sxy family protein [Ignavibacteria bacterium]|nr:TfoX/Sxy family protein [Ignavibacteria bacterium]MBI3764913.1 TfoX/Sxy family protein [Ignavibacteriales bacterium]